MLMIIIYLEDKPSRFIMVMNYFEAQTWTRSQEKIQRLRVIRFAGKVIFSPTIVYYKITTWSSGQISINY